MSEMDTTYQHHHAHHFANANEEFETCKQGMWLFLVTEILMFGGLFVAYGIFKGLYPDMFVQAHHLLDWKMGAINTIILISSSLTMALAVGAAQRGNNARAGAMLLFTILFACGFLVVKYFEYTHKFHMGVFPAKYFNLHDEHAQALLTHPKAPLFFSLYFVMTGLHGVHVLIGIGLIFWIWMRTRKKEFGPGFYTPVELVGFYWHFVDLVWIYLFPLLYLIG